MWMDKRRAEIMLLRTGEAGHRFVPYQVLLADSLHSNLISASLPYVGIILHSRRPALFVRTH